MGTGCRKATWAGEPPLLAAWFLQTKCHQQLSLGAPGMWLALEEPPAFGTILKTPPGCTLCLSGVISGFPEPLQTACSQHQAFTAAQGSPSACSRPPSGSSGVPKKLPGRRQVGTTCHLCLRRVPRTISSQRVVGHSCLMDTSQYSVEAATPRPWWLAHSSHGSSPPAPHLGPSPRNAPMVLPHLPASLYGRKLRDGLTACEGGSPCSGERCPGLGRGRWR